MLYLVVNKKQYTNKIELFDKSNFMELYNDSIFKEYMFLNYTGDNHDDCINLLLKNKIKSRIIEPYLSINSFEQIFTNIPLVRTEEVHIEFKDYSFFEDLLASYARIYPTFDAEYVLLPTITDVPKEQFLKELYDYNYSLYKNKLLLIENNIRPSLAQIYLEAFDKIIQEEANSDFIRKEDIEHINSVHKELLETQFLIEASKHYTNKQIKKFIEGKLYPE